MKNIYGVEVGILLQKDNKDYDCYSNVFDKKHGYYNENMGFFETLEQAKKYVVLYIKEGVLNTYGVITEILVNEYENFKEIEESFELFSYEKDDVIYCKYKDIDSQIKNIWEVE